MSQADTPTPLSAEDYDAIESALRGTERGRWFLEEVARRRRTADTQVLLDAIAHLETAIQQPRSSVDLILRDLTEMHDAIARARREISAMRTDVGAEAGPPSGAAALEAVVRQGERATRETAAAIEEIQETAWRLREANLDLPACATLDRRSADIFQACAAQESAWRQIETLVQTLRFVDTRLRSMIDIWGLDDLEIEGAGGAPEMVDGAVAFDGDTGIDGMIAGFDDIEIVEVGDRGFAGFEDHGRRATSAVTRAEVALTPPRGGGPRAVPPQPAHAGQPHPPAPEMGRASDVGRAPDPDEEPPRADDGVTRAEAFDALPPVSPEGLDKARIAALLS